jgi:hypothetical protein
LQENRWKSHKSESYDDDENETKSQLFQRHFFQRLSQHDERHVDFMSEKNMSDSTTKTTASTSNKSFHQSSQQRDEQSHIEHAQRRKPKRRDFVNCQKLLDWANPSSVKKLMPIFILINMLPFLYAGESFRLNIFA